MRKVRDQLPAPKLKMLRLHDRLCHWTHQHENVPEWEDPEGSSRPISLERIMREVGISDSKRAEEHVQERRSLAEILAED